MNKIEVHVGNLPMTKYFEFLEYILKHEIPFENPTGFVYVLLEDDMIVIKLVLGF
jgi:hypothetical protein